MTTEQPVDLSYVEGMLSEILLTNQQIYTAILFILGVASACFVCFLLYNFLRKFF